MMPKDLRAAYATIAWEWFAPPHIAQSAYIARILGHSELDLVTVQSYIDFYPLGHKRDFQRAHRAGLRDAINQLAQLTQAEPDERNDYSSKNDERNSKPNSTTTPLPEHHAQRHAFPRYRFYWYHFRPYTLSELRTVPFV